MTGEIVTPETYIRAETDFAFARLSEKMQAATSTAFITFASLRP